MNSIEFEEYHKALKQGQKDVKAALSRGESQWLRVLSEDQDALAVRRESLGIVEIPIELLDGTCNQLRRDAFSPGFYPILQEGSEFSQKWAALCASHLEEGIRDPIKAVEYLHHFYVVEGHKRVSVLKYFGAITVPGVVTRLIPKYSDDPEVVAYYEFLDYYHMTGLHFPVFRKPGEYGELLEIIGRTSREAWSAEEIYNFRSLYFMFRNAYFRQSGQREDLSESFLVYLKIFGYRDSMSKMSTQIAQELGKIHQEIRNRTDNAGTALVLDDSGKKPLITLPTSGKLCAAFIHGGLARSSSWVYSHEYGRFTMENNMNGQVQTMSYENVLTDEEAEKAIEDAVAKGADVIFTTTPKLLLVSVKEAVLHPEVKILNCSLNTTYPSVRTYYPRLYEAKFIKGAIAGTLTPDGRIGYVADYPTYGNIAGINAFAQGAKMVNANAKIFLEWSQLEKGGGEDRLREQGIIYIDALDRLSANIGAQLPGSHSLALAMCRWGNFYQSIVQRIIEGTWKNDMRGSSAINYWWGMNQGVVDVLCSRSLSTGARRLVSVLKDAIRAGRLDPFYGVLLDQQGHVAHGDDAPLSADQILTMNWLSDRVVGRIPDYEELTERGKILTKLQGVEKKEA